MASLMSESQYKNYILLIMKKLINDNCIINNVIDNKIKISIEYVDWFYELDENIKNDVKFNISEFYKNMIVDLLKKNNNIDIEESNLHCVKKQRLN